MSDKPKSKFKKSKEKIMQELNVKATRAWVLGLTSLASFMVALDALVVATALSTIRRDLGASIEQLGCIKIYSSSPPNLLTTLSGPTKIEPPLCTVSRIRLIIFSLSSFTMAIHT